MSIAAFFANAGKKRTREEEAAADTPKPQPRTIVCWNAK
jgi:hypothetical protein